MKVSPQRQGPRGDLAASIAVQQNQDASAKHDSHVTYGSGNGAAGQADRGEDDEEDESVDAFHGSKSTAADANADGRGGGSGGGGGGGSSSTDNDGSERHFERTGMEQLLHFGHSRRVARRASTETKSRKRQLRNLLNLSKNFANPNKRNQRLLTSQFDTKNLVNLLRETLTALLREGFQVRACMHGYRRAVERQRVGVRARAMRLAHATREGEEEHCLHVFFFFFSG
jgi:hypothetical protein